MILIVVALVAACGALPTGSPGASSPASSPPADAGSYAQQVLAAAIIPPGARSTTTVDSDFLKQAFETPGMEDLIDIHALYAIEELPNAVETFVKTHVPSGAKATGTGTLGSPQGSADGIEVSMPTSGPNENFAQLVYVIVADGANSTEFRIDAQVVWVPNRSAAELAPSNAVVELTGFTQTSLANPSSGPVAIELSGAQANALETVVNSLPLAPHPFCMEDALLYRIVFRPAAASSQSFELDGYECVRTVLVLQDGKELSPLSDASCYLLRAVIDLLPAGKADATRSASADCAT